MRTLTLRVCFYTVWFMSTKMLYTIPLNLPVSSTVLLLLKMLVEYCQLVDDIPSACPDILTRLIDLLKVWLTAHIRCTHSRVLKPNGMADRQVVYAFQSRTNLNTHSVCCLETECEIIYIDGIYSALKAEWIGIQDLFGYRYYIWHTIH